MFDLAFAGFGGHPIRAWLRLPRARSGRLPGIVRFHGYASGRGHAVDDLLWASAGYAHLLVDVRGQGGDYAGGDTGDPVGGGPAYPGFLTKGIESRESYFYRRVFVDAVRAVKVLRRLDFVDPDRIAAIGESQGGGIALAVAGLVLDLAALYVQAPLLCDVRRAMLITDAFPYQEIAGHLRSRRLIDGGPAADRVFHALGDGKQYGLPLDWAASAIYYNKEERALEVLALLADRGHHRAPSIPDLLIAATAELADLAVLHHDKDFDLIAEITGQPLERLTLP